MDIYQHFRKEEKPFIDEVLDWISDAEEKYLPKRTDFLNPRQQDIAQSLVSRDSPVTLCFAGGSEHAERKRALFVPPYQEPQIENFALCAFELQYPRKFATVTHPELLGALMGLGIKREKFGDLLFTNDTIHIVVAAEIAEFVQLNLTEVGLTPVSLKAIALTDILDVKEVWQTFNKTASSLRLDVVISVIYQQSRAKMTERIRKKLVKVNWRVIEQPSFNLQAGDYISVRRLGRSKLVRVEGMTKKGKYRIIVGK